MKANPQEIIVGLDLGTSKIRVAIGKRCAEGIDIIGVGQSPSQGLRKGQVINIGITAGVIRKTINQAECMAGCKVRNVVVGIADVTIRSQNSHGEVRIEQKNVSEQDIRKVIQSARKIPLPPDREILHTIPCEFIIDKQIRTSQPLGMTGSTLEVTTHIITVASASIKNIVNACILAGLNELNIVLQSLATAETLLRPDEREQGVMHIDFGGGSAKIAVYSKGVLWRYNRSLLSGNKITEDVAVGLRISMLQAEQVKCHHGCCFENKADSDYKVELVPHKGNGTRQLSRSIFAQIIGPRMEEMLTLIAQGIEQSGHNEKLSAGAVITGGTSLLMDIGEFAEQVLNMPVRIGTSGTINGVLDTVSQPQHSTAVSLVLLGGNKEGATQGIRVKTGNSLLLRATLAIKHVREKFGRHTYANTRSRYSGEYPLFYAISCRDEAEARRLLATGADTNERTAYGTTPLMQAVYGCTQGLITDLLAAGADPLLQDKRGYSVLVHALHRRDSETVEIFQHLYGFVAAHPLDFNGFCLADHVMMRVLRYKNAGCNVPYDTGHVALTKATMTGNCRMLTDLLSDEIPRRILTNAMVLASQCGHLKCVRILIAKNADVNGLSVYGRSPLGAASAGLYPELVKYLVEAGAIVSTRNDAGESPLYEACAYMALDRISRRTREQRLADQFETARILLSAGADANMCSDSGCAAISNVACAAQSPDLVKLLLEWGAVPPPPKDASGKRMMMLSSRFNREILEILGHCDNCSCEHEKDPSCQYRCYL